MAETRSILLALRWIATEIMSYAIAVSRRTQGLDYPRIRGRKYIVLSLEYDRHLERHPWLDRDSRSYHGAMAVSAFDFALQLFASTAVCYLSGCLLTPRHLAM